MSGAAKFFESSFKVQPEDIDGQGHVNNVVYVRWVQDVAVAHWRHTAPLEDQRRLSWIVLRHEIDYKQPALAGDTVFAKTWVGPATRLRFERNTELRRWSDGTLLAKARTLWCPVDSETGRPALVSPAVRALFSIDAAPAGQPG